MAHTPHQIQIIAINLRGLFIFLACTVPLLVKGQVSNPPPGNISDQSVVSIGNRLELFVDPFMIEHLDNALRQMHQPRREAPALYFDKPWEGAFSGYISVFKDGDKYRMYYRALPEAGKDGSATESTAYAESTDGINWHKPNLGLFEVRNTLENNVILANAPPFSHNFSPFLDTRPDVEEAQKYKALAGTKRTGLVAFVSADGLRWEKLQEKPVITNGIFDSQNIAFWSEAEQQYVSYFRTWTGEGYKGHRTISRATSPDFIHWSDSSPMSFGDTPTEHLYTNATQPYYRAPHIYLAFPNRFFPDKAVLNQEVAKALVENPSYQIHSSDAVFMSSRGGTEYDRSFMEAFMPPGPSDEDWVSRNNMPAWGIVPGNDRVLFLYRLGHYAQSTSHVIRYSLRIDGFASVRAPYEGGEMITRPFTFAGNHLQINFATSAAGFVKVEIQDMRGNLIPGFSLEQAIEHVGDRITQQVAWASDPSLGSLQGQPVRLRFVMKDADLYSFQFVE